MNTRVRNLELLLEEGMDSAVLRLSLGNEYLKDNKSEMALEHLRKAVELDPEYSAAWKSYGKACTSAGRKDEAVTAYERGIETARAHGDVQAMKEMTVFLKRLQKTDH